MQAWESWAEDGLLKKLFDDVLLNANRIVKVGGGNMYKSPHHKKGTRAHKQPPKKRQRAS